MLQDILRESVVATNQSWIELLHHRHKIWAAYVQSQSITAQLKRRVTNIDAIAGVMRSCRSTMITKYQLNQLQESLFETFGLFDTYTSLVQQLSDQGHTIETNRANYLDRACNMANKNPGSDLQFLQEFNNNKHTDRYARQLAADHAVLAPRINYLSETQSSH